MKQVISITLLLLTLVVNVLPYIPASECDMPCCQPEISCCSNDEQISPASMTQCEQIISVPLVEGPFSKYKLQKEMPLEGTPVVHRVPVAAAVYGKCPAQVPEAELPPSFLFPLLI
ncbi:MAG: hypothetical protein ACE5EE_10610 [Fidelibacterota bacterium]